MDLDGTLEDSRADMVGAANRVRADLGLAERPFAELAPHVSKGMDHLYRNCFAEMFGAPEGRAPRQPGQLMAGLAQRYQSAYSAGIAEQTRPYNGIPESLAALCRLGAIVVYTNKPEALSNQLLVALRLAPYIERVIGSDTYAETKPDPEPLRRVARDLGHAPGDRSVFVGDSGGDMQAARNFGARALWAAWGYYADAPQPEPEEIVDSPEALVQVVTRWFQSGATTR